MPIYNLIKYSQNYSDTSGSLWQFKRDEIINNADVTNNNNASSFKCKASIIGDTRDIGTKDKVKIVVPLKYFSNFWRSLEMPLIKCKVELSLQMFTNYYWCKTLCSNFYFISRRQCKTVKITKQRILKTNLLEWI